MKKITLTTVKSFIRKNPNLYINCKSRFDGMVDCVMPCDNQGFEPVELSDRNSSNTLGIEGAWFVLGGGDRFYPHEDDNFEGIEVYNCCGSFILATRKAA
jgi:hypothetical protein